MGVRILDKCIEDVKSPAGSSIMKMMGMNSSSTFQDHHNSISFAVKVS